MSKGGWLPAAASQNCAYTEGKLLIRAGESCTSYSQHAGDRDDVVKLWDLRKATLPTSHINPAVEAACLGSSPSQTIGKRQHGVTCLTLSPEGMPISATCTCTATEQPRASRGCAMTRSPSCRTV